MRSRIVVAGRRGKIAKIASAMPDEAALFGFVTDSGDVAVPGFSSIDFGLGTITVVNPQLQDPAGDLGFAIRTALGTASRLAFNAFAPRFLGSAADVPTDTDQLPDANLFRATRPLIEAQRAALGPLTTSLDTFLSVRTADAIGATTGVTVLRPGTDPASIDVAALGRLAEQFQAESLPGARVPVNTAIDGVGEVLAGLVSSAALNAVQGTIAVGRRIGMETFARVRDFTLGGVRQLDRLSFLNPALLAPGSASFGGFNSG